MRLNLSSVISIALVASLMFVSSAPTLEAATKRTNKAVFKETVSTADLADAYAKAAAGGVKVRILVVPGHEPGFGGTEFAGFYERELVVDIANQLARELRTDTNFEVFVARGNQGWNTDFTRYFDTQGKKIERFVETHKSAMGKLEKKGKIDDSDEQAAHNEARPDVALRLYGISKWADENTIDLVLHLHLNDETSHAAGVRGVHSGAAIYVPDALYGNAKTSKAIAEPVLARLNATTPTSTFGLERKGIVPGRELIAIGSYNTLAAPSLLIEYGYIYEPRITGSGARSEVLADYAYQTALGVKDFFGTPARPRFASKVLPYQFTTDPLAPSSASSTPPDARSIYALQASLAELGFYPGTEASLVECPVSGILGLCTRDAVKAFQASKGLEQTGQLGVQTRVAFNSAFGLTTPLASIPTVPTVAAVPAASASCTAFANILKINSTDTNANGEVTRLQQILAKDAAVYPEGKITGYFGPATLAAVQRFQTKNAIATKGSAGYGSVGPLTGKALCS